MTDLEGTLRNARDAGFVAADTLFTAGLWRDKNAVRAELSRPLFARFATKYRNTATRFVAEGVLLHVRRD